MYETLDGKPTEKDLNKKYWVAKDGKPATISSGFRVWAKSSETKYKAAADADTIQFEMFDFGI